MKISRRDIMNYGLIGTGAAWAPGLLSQTNSSEDSKFPNSIMNGNLKDSQGMLQVLAGEIPKDLYGHIFIMEGIPLEKNHFSPAGKGAITRLDFMEDGQIAFKRSMVRTPSVLLQENLAKGWDQFQLLGGLSYLSPSLGFMNFCNTAPIPMGDNRVCLSFEGGIPHEIDTLTLEVATPIGSQEEWLSSLPAFAEKLSPKRWLFPQIRTTAHPYFDNRTGEAFSINYGGNLGMIGKGFLRLLLWDREGKLQHRSVINRQGEAAFLKGTGHALGVTKNFIVIFDTAARVEAERVIGLNKINPQEHVTPIWIIKRSDLTANRDWVYAESLQLDFDTSDIMVEYDDFDGLITFYGEYLSATDRSEPMYAGEQLSFAGKVPAIVSGYPIAPNDLGGLVKAVVKCDAQGVREIKGEFRVIRDAQLTWDMNDPAHREQFQFPDRYEHIYWAAIGYRPEHVVERASKVYKDYPERVYSERTLPRSAVGSALLHQDCQKMEIVDSFSFPDHMVMRTIQFMPRKGDSSRDQSRGYVMSAVVVNNSYEAKPSPRGKEIWIFDAEDLARGPLCRLHHPDLDFATTNHASWVDSIGARPSNAYRADTYEHYQSKLGFHSREVVSIVKSQIFSRFL